MHSILLLIKYKAFIEWNENSSGVFPWPRATTIVHKLKQYKFLQ